jgi:DeoR/GlpR family transcriptional regulator of sugar metabolism
LGKTDNGIVTVTTVWTDGRNPRAELFLLGGRVFKHSAVTCGAAAVEAAQNVSADLCLLGVTGVHPEAGLTTGDAEEAAMKRALSARAADTYILASCEKIGTASPYRVLPWEKITGLITDADPHDTVIEQLKTLGVEVLVA